MSDIKNLIGTGVCTKIQTTQPPPESRASRISNHKAELRTAEWKRFHFLCLNVLRTPYTTTIGVKREHTDPDKGGGCCVTPLFFLYLFHGLDTVPSKVPRNSFFFGFPGSTIRFWTLRIRVYFLFLITWSLWSSWITYITANLSPKLSVPPLAQWRTRDRIRNHLGCKDHGSKLRFIDP